MSEDRTSPYNVTAAPEGTYGPGKWPTERPSGTSLSVFEDIVRQTEEPFSRIALRYVVVVVVIALVTLGSLAWRSLDDRVEDLEFEIQILKVQLDELADEVDGTAAETDASG
ncbi:MAG TPA: hypothetical protein VGA13_05835 [Acidimicrobiales bacterium]